MAQPVFDEHPLEHYLRQAGEDLEPMPGTTAELTQELEPFSLSLLADADESESDTGNHGDQSEVEWRPHFLIYLSQASLFLQLLYFMEGNRTCQTWFLMSPSVAMADISFSHQQAIEHILANAQLTRPVNPFVERFKYNVISSTLLSSDLPNPHTHTHSRNSSTCNQLPGKFSHSRTPSEHIPSPQNNNTLSTPHPLDAATGGVNYGLLSGLSAVFSVLLGVGLTTLAMLTLWVGLAAIYYLSVRSQSARHLDLTPCLQTLDGLISTNALWESIVHEVITTLEKDERTVLGSSSSHTSPSSPLRVALHSTLQTTETQCDNVRHLLSALTTPSELSQLAEMYAPPSPQKSHFAPMEFSPRLSKSFSYPHRTHRSEGTTSVPSSSPTRVMLTDHKRMTWNGPSSTSMAPMKRALKRRSDLSSASRSPPSGSIASFSAPVTPALSSPLAKVSELSNAGSPHFNDPFVQSPDEEVVEVDGIGSSFAAAALKLQQNRIHDGLETFSNDHSPPPSPPLSPLRRPLPHTAAISHTPEDVSPLGRRRSARFASIHASRQPISLSALRHSLQAAVGAKRYACAHLLALRFTGDDTAPASLSQTFANAAGYGVGEVEAGYWDDVKSIIELLIGALSDASARLCEAVRQVDAMRLRDQTPTPVESVDRHTPATSPGSGLVEVRKLIAEKEGKRTRLSEMMMLGNDLVPTAGGVVSYAPMPSPLNRFAGHVATIQTALEDSRRYLEDCVNDLKSSNRSVPSIGDEEHDDDDSHPALQAYEKLRRELGFALRECERGRNRLLDIVKPPQPVGMEFEEEEGSLPGLAHDSQSDESDKHDLSPVHSEDGAKDAVGVVNPDEGDVDVRFVDDASRELLLSVDVAHLPPAHLGTEQVFEADTSVSSDMPPIRPKTKLSREERIRLVKARRESGLGLGGMGMDLKPSPLIHGDDDDGDSGEGGGGYGEKWGPGGDVVQELKDVIWKVGERRRKVQEGGSVKGVQSPLPLTDQLVVSEQQPVTESQLNMGLQPAPREEQLSLSLSGEPAITKSVVHDSGAVDSLVAVSSSKLPTLILSPRPRRMTSSRIISPLANNGTESTGSGLQSKLRPRRASLIPRRSSSIAVSATATAATAHAASSEILQRSSMMNMSSLLESLKREVGERGTREGEQVLSSE